MPRQKTAAMRRRLGAYALASQKRFCRSDRSARNARRKTVSLVTRMRQQPNVGTMRASSAVRKNRRHRQLWVLGRSTLRALRSVAVGAREWSFIGELGVLGVFREIRTQTCGARGGWIGLIHLKPLFNPPPGLNFGLTWINPIHSVAGKGYLRERGKMCNFAEIIKITSQLCQKQ